MTTSRQSELARANTEALVAYQQALAVRRASQVALAAATTQAEQAKNLFDKTLADFTRSFNDGQLDRAATAYGGLAGSQA